MVSIWRKISQKIRKPLIFALWGAGGCLLASISIGELFLRVTNPSDLELEEPQTVVLLIDTSQSMGEGDKLDQVKTAAKLFIDQQKHPQYNFALIQFDLDAKVAS